MKVSRLLSAALLGVLLSAPAHAESRIRLSTAVGVSSEDPSLGEQTLKYNQSGTLLATASAEDKKDTQTVGGNTLQYITEGGWILGVHQHTNSFTTIATQTGSWASTSALDALDAVTAGTKATVLGTLGGISSNGTVLGNRESKGYVNFLDVGYLFGGDTFSLSAGLGLPLLGSSSETNITYTVAGASLNGGLLTEQVESEGKSALSYFLDLGYRLGGFELLLGYRSVETKSEATVDRTQGLGKILDSDQFESTGKHTLTTVGVGFVF